MFDGFEEKKDETAGKRWLASSGTSLGVCVLAGVAIVILSRTAGQKAHAEEELDVTFHAQPEPEIKQEAPPPPPPPPKATKRPGRTAPASPTAIPEAAPEEATPTGDTPVQADPEEYGDGGEDETTTPAPPPPPPPPPPVEKDPDPVFEDDPGVVPAKAVEANALPVYPESARKKGVEAVVILKIVISPAGTVSSVKVVKGDEPFVTAAVEAVKTWRYTPARLDGKPAAMSRLVKIPFRIHT
jgi:periplasmic protein TonB